MNNHKTYKYTKIDEKLNMNATNNDIIKTPNTSDEKLNMNATNNNTTNNEAYNKIDESCVDCDKAKKNFDYFRILDSLGVNQILKLLENESKQLKALVLTFLSSQKSKKILEHMGTNEQKSILERISRIRNVNINIVSKIEDMLKNDVNSRICKLLTVDGKSISSVLKSGVADNITNMVVEKERKFIIKTPDRFNQLMSSENLLGVRIKDKSTKKRHYIYFDTDDLVLYNSNITYGVRDRKKDYALTLKLPTNKGLIEREEYNASVSSEDNKFGVSIHNDNANLVPVRLVNNFIKKATLKEKEKFRVTTTRCRVEPENGHILEVSFDRINAESRDGLKGVEFYEVEIENKGADDDLFTRFCDRFSREMNLEEMNKSKYQRVTEHFKEMEMLKKSIPKDRTKDNIEDVTKNVDED